MKYLLSFLVILALASIACRVNIDVPDELTTGPEVTDQITVAAPQIGAVRLKISFGAGELRLSPGAVGALVTGTATYNVAEFKPEVVEEGNSIEIRQGDFTTLNVVDLVNRWDLNLGSTPMELEINAGAYQGIYEFGGLALTDLTVKDGASNVDLSFSEPNLTEMSVLRYETGASNVELSGLANANFSTLFFNGGAGNYVLDFSGELLRDATAEVETGFGDLSLVIPENVDARVTVEGTAVNVNHSSGWAESNRTYTQEGTGPSLRIIVQMGAGNVTITD